MSYGYLGTYSYSGSGVGLSVFAGARYFFSETGAYGEMGYGITWLQLGLALTHHPYPPPRAVSLRPGVPYCGRPGRLRLLGRRTHRPAQ